MRVFDVIEVLGLCSIAAGAFMLSVPAGLIVAGVLATAWAVLSAWGGVPEGGHE